MYEFLHINEPSRWLRALGPVCVVVGAVWFAQETADADEQAAPRLMQASLMRIPDASAQPTPKPAQALPHRSRKGKARSHRAVLHTNLPTDSPAVAILSGEGDSDDVGTGEVEDDGPPQAAPPPPPLPYVPPHARPFSWSWNCDWPLTNVNETTVHVRVHVSARGRAESVDIVSAKHHEFAAEAKVCALQKSYVASRDEHGQPIAGTTDVLPIHFKRYGSE